MSVGRNDPCPCGSGKKYKRCCLVTDGQASRPPGQDWHDLDQRLACDIGQWAERRFGKVWRNCMSDYPTDIDERHEHLPLFVAWASCERKVEGRPVAAWYLEERGRYLMAHERDWLAAQLRSWLSVWEVVDVEPGKTIRLKDLLTAEERTVSEVTGSRTLTPHLLLLARVVDHAGFSLLIGMHPHALPPEAGQETVDQIREDLGLGKRATPQEMREGGRPTELIEIWDDAVEETAHRPMPQLRNTDGDDLVFIRDHFKLAGKDARTKLEAELARLPDVEVPAANARERRYSIVRVDAPGAAMQNTIIASLVVKARECVVETNSRQRADGMRSRMESAFANLLRFDQRDEKDVAELMEEQPDRPTEAPPELKGPEVDAVLRDLKARHYATWPDHSLPALDGLTPREAAAQPKYRACLQTLLKEMEYLESREEPGRRFDFSGMRRTLGLE